MSDEQIRDVFQNAEEWTPDNDDEEDSDGNVNGIGARLGPNSALPPLQLGSDVEIAGCVAQLLRQERGEVVFSEGAFWYYAGSHWRKIDDHELRLAVHRYDGSTIPGSSSRVKLGKTRVDSVLSEMTPMLARPNFFDGASVGINCASGFIGFAPDGTPHLRPHDPGDRCRHVLKGSWTEGWLADEQTIFTSLESLDVLLAHLLDGVFLGDPDAKEKRQLLAEISGAAALGYGTKLLEPKAIILEGKTAENGKSQVLDLFRGLLPSDAVTSIPAAKMGDERFLVGLVGKHLNASDELSGAEAIASEVFKAVVTGEFVTGRDVYRSAIPFRSVAQNVFATNTLPSFKGGMDRGVQRRLLVLTFNRTIPAEQRVERIGQRISEEEADLLLAWAVAGASQLIRQRRFTVPPSSRTALQEWLLSADPVLAWMHTCVEVVDPKSPDWKTATIKSAHAYDAFNGWAKREGFRENTLPASNSFTGRLRANRPSIAIKHARDGNFLIGIKIVSSEGGPDVADFFDERLR